MRHGVRPFVSPAHLSFLGHPVTDDLVHRRLGDTATDRQVLAIPSSVVDHRVRVVPLHSETMFRIHHSVLNSYPSLVKGRLSNS